MLVHLARLGDPELDLPADMFTQRAASDRVGTHRLTESPESADLILFTQCHMVPRDWRQRTIRRHPLVRAHRDKVLVFNERDLPWCAMPGVYVNMPSRTFAPRHQRPWGYWVPEQVPLVSEPDLLCSFIGSDTAACRRPLFALRHPAVIVEESRGFQFWQTEDASYWERRERYQTVLARSRFALCPRGNGISTFRLYEALAIGAVPVIISDEWVAPPGPAWEQCSIRWPEGRTDGLLEMLADRDRDWPRMSARARRAHDEHFADGVYFHRVVERCAELLASGSPAAFPRRGLTGRQYATVAADAARWRGWTLAFRARDAIRRSRG